MSFEIFCDYIKSKQDVTFLTIKQKKAFTIWLDDIYLYITPLSSGSERQTRLSTVEKVYNYNKSSGSYITSDYTDFTLHSSYILSLLDSFYKQQLRFETYKSIDDESAIEGYKLDLLILKTTRNQKLATKAKLRDKYTCQVCSYKVKINETYVIDCHHTNPLAITGETKTELDTLVCLCPNCHRVAHLKSPPYTVLELKELIFPSQKIQGGYEVRDCQ